MAHAIASLDLAQNADYPLSLRQSHAPNRLEPKLTHCRSEVFSLARIFCVSQDRTKPIESGTREIRLSEQSFYQKITGIYAISVDYNKDAPTTKAFFAKVRNKLHYANLAAV